MQANSPESFASLSECECVPHRLLDAACILALTLPTGSKKVGEVHKQSKTQTTYSGPLTHTQNMSANDGSSMQMRTHPTFTIPAASDIVYDATSKEASRRTGDMSMSRAKQAFVTRPEYRQCTPISDFIATNYRLPSNTKNRSGKDEASKSVYLDFGGAGLPMHTVLKKEYQLFATSVFGNPHSCSPS